MLKKMIMGIKKLHKLLKPISFYTFNTIIITMIDIEGSWKSLEEEITIYFRNAKPSKENSDVYFISINGNSIEEDYFPIAWSKDTILTQSNFFNTNKLDFISKNQFIANGKKYTRILD